MSDFREHLPFQTLLDVLQWRAATQPDDEVFTFLVDGETQEESLSYSQLYRRARGIGAQLQGIGEVGERAIILCPAGLDYIAAFFGCICSGWAAVPLYAPNPDHHIQTIRTVVGSAGPRVGITTRAMLPRIEALFSALPELEGLQWLLADETPSGAEDTWRQPEIGPDSLAYLVYTSGSTSAPKGVPKAHKNLRLIPLETVRGDAPTREKAVDWTSPSVTSGLTMAFVLPVCADLPTVLMTPESVLERPARWIEAMSRTRATQTSVANFAFDLAVDAIPPEDRARLDLSCWTSAFTGGEQVRAETIERFETAFAVSGLRRGIVRAGYGLTEAARVVQVPPDRMLTVQSFDRAKLEAGRVVPLARGSEGGRVMVGLGYPNPGVEVVIVEPESHTPCAPDTIGEIWTAGLHVSDGYWNEPEATRDAFQAYLATGDRPAEVALGPYFRTGDLGFFYEGELFITGRLKDIIIIRGRNIPATDVEAAARRSHTTLESHAAAAFAVEATDSSGEGRTVEGLVIVQEIGQESDTATVAATIRRTIAVEIGIQLHAVVLVPVGAIPRTRGGKLQRAACRDAYLGETLRILFSDAWVDHAAARSTRHVPPTTEPERQLVTIWEGVLGVQPIGIHDEFVDLGGDSLRSLQVMARMREHGLYVNAQALKRNGTVAALARVLSEEAPPATDDGPVVGPVPLLLMQEAVLGNRAELPANLIAIRPFTATAPLDPELLDRAARRVVFHHDALRMRFQYIPRAGASSGRWEATCLAQTPSRIVSSFDLSAVPVEQHRDVMMREVWRLRGEIDIRHGPLFQIALFKGGTWSPGESNAPRDHTVFLLPHLVFDAFSFPILLHDLETAYRQLRAGEPTQLPARTTSIRRWGEVVHALVASEEMRAEAAYWADILRGGPTRLPMDAWTGDATGGGLIDVRMSLDADSTGQLLRLAPLRHGFRISDALLYAIASAVGMQSGAISVLADLWSHGREPLAPDIDLSRTVGYFTTQFPVLVQLDPDSGILTNVARLHDQIVRIPHHGIGFAALRYLCQDELCNELRVGDRPLRLNFFGEPDSRYRGLTLFTADRPTTSNSVDASDDPGMPEPVIVESPAHDLLDIAAFLRDGQLMARITYHTDVYRRATIEEFAANITQQLSHVASLMRSQS